MYMFRIKNINILIKKYHFQRLLTYTIKATYFNSIIILYVYIFFGKCFIVFVFACAYRPGTECAALPNCNGRRFSSGIKPSSHTAYHKNSAKEKETVAAVSFSEVKFPKKTNNFLGIGATRVKGQIFGFA